MFMKKIMLGLFLALATTLCHAYGRQTIYVPTIKTLQVVVNQDWLSPPVMKLNSTDVLNISFDEMSHDYHRFVYKIEHCEADWSVSDELFESDYIEGFNNNPIEDYQNSINTTVLYTHYKLQIPNEECRLKMSGNYRLIMIDENDGGRPVLSACFMVVEQAASVGLSVTSNTDIDINKSHQQVDMQVNYGRLNVNDPSSQIKTVVMQNRRWDNARINPKPQYIMPDGLKWEHNRDMIFEAGNEYRKFEILDVSHPTMGIDRIVWDGTDYQVYPYACEPRLNYVYDEDANGAFYIRNSDNIENDVASEYVYVNYVLHTAQDIDGEIYLNGAWTNGQFTPEYRMNYDDTAGCYKASVLQKQGYYSYQFVLVDGNGTSRTVPSEGSFYQTENTYQALVYYRGQGERADRLVGYGHVRIK